MNLAASRPPAGSAGVSPAGEAEGHWHSRGYVPHFDRPGAVQMLTFRLADALPASKLSELEGGSGGYERLRRQRIESYLDAGHGACYLGDPRVAGLVERSVLYWDTERYHLLAWVVMPNHVHVLIETLPDHRLAEVTHAWKSCTAKEANRFLGRVGRFWQPEYFDRAIRDETHLASAIRYIHDSPVKAGLVERAEDWPYSSGGRAGETPALPGHSTQPLVADDCCHSSAPTP